MLTWQSLPSVAPFLISSLRPDTCISTIPPFDGLVPVDPPSRASVLYPFHTPIPTTFAHFVTLVSPPFLSHKFPSSRITWINYLLVSAPWTGSGPAYLLLTSYPPFQPSDGLRRDPFASWCVTIQHAVPRLFPDPTNSLRPGLISPFFVVRCSFFLAFQFCNSLFPLLLRKVPDGTPPFVP